MKKEATENKLDNEIEDEIRKEKKSIKFTLTQVVMMVVVGIILGAVGTMAIIQNKSKMNCEETKVTENEIIENEIIENEIIENEIIENDIIENDIIENKITEDCTINIDHYNYRDTTKLIDINDMYIDEVDEKPIIYIYPEKKTEVTVKLGNPELLTVTYPKYESEGWKVIAEPDGTLEDVKTGRGLYCLYWEGLNSKKYEGELKEGFVVNGEEIAKFLEEKLEILGLNEKEAQEFIIYWLPKLEINDYNYIRFQTKEEIEQNMPLEINPNPDTIIRVMMEWKGLENPVEVEEQSLEKAERKGYTVVEWGGTELK